MGALTTLGGRGLLQMTRQAGASGSMTKSVSLATIGPPVLGTPHDRDRSHRAGAPPGADARGARGAPDRGRVVKVFKRAAELDQGEYDEKVAAGLDRAFAGARTRDVQLSELRVVILSDLHRGARDGADDFQGCEPAYSAALGWYLERGYQLYLLGDVEELWENDIGEVLPRYLDCAKLEKAFMDGPGLTRFFGNHDIDWRDAGKVKTHLGPLLPGIEMLEALKLRVLDGTTQLGLFFLVHGHQGTDLSDRGAGLSRLVLRWVWRQIQNRLGWLSTTPAGDFDLRAKHDIAMFRWSRRAALAAPAERRAAMIAGHTHHPVFPDHPPPVPGAGDTNAVKAKLDEARAR